jgi:methyl-accepting chemotaxis protein
MNKKMTLKQRLLFLTVGLNVVSLLFCGFMIAQTSDIINNTLLLLTAGGLVGWAFYSFFFVTRIGKDFSKIIMQLLTDSQQMRGSVKDITDASNRLAQATTEQASALQETAASIEEMSAMIKKSAEGAHRSRDVAMKSRHVATKGKSSVDEMMVAIDDIHQSHAQIMQAIDQSHKEFSEIVRVISEIGQKTKVINDIVFQTKLLSFNASVEAARAGEHGKGFAVVAEEVGNLAQMSGNAAKEISNMLDGSVKKVEGIVNGTREKVNVLITQGRRKVDAGTSIAKICGEVLEEVVQHVSSLNLMVEEISTASQEQAQGITEITRAINQLDQVTHSNAITSQQTASAAIQLDAQTTSTLSYIDKLHEIVNGENYKMEKNYTSKISKPAALINISNQLKFKKNNDIDSVTQMASGSESVPSHDDPRFKDV